MSHFVILHTCIWWYIVNLDLVIAFCDFIMRHCDILFENQFSKLNKCIFSPLYFTSNFQRSTHVFIRLLKHRPLESHCHAHDHWPSSYWPMPSWKMTTINSIMDNGVFLYLLYNANKNYALIENQSHTIETNGLFSKGKPVLLQLQVGIDFVRFACTSMCWYA